MSSYGARIFDRSSGRFIFTAPGVGSPYRVGQIAAGAFSSLVGRDGFDEKDLEVRSFVDDGGRLRRMDRIEEGEMNTAFQEFISKARDDTGRAGIVPGEELRSSHLPPPLRRGERLDEHAA